MNKVFQTHTFSGGQQLEVVQGDITAESVDAIVNAANSYLQHGGGVAGIISSKGGPAIQRESDAWVRQHGLVTHEHPAWTTGGRLPCRYVIHAVGPIWGSGDEEARLAAAVKGSLELAERLGLSSVAIPAISTGIFGFPVDLAARIFFKTIALFYKLNPESSLNLVRITLFGQPALESFLSAFEEWRESL